MQRQRGELVPIGEVVADLDGPVKAIREASPQARHHFTRFDQVNQLVGASEADPDLGFMARMLVLCSLPRSNPGNRIRYVRHNGHYTLYMTAGGGCKLPFGNRRTDQPPGCHRAGGTGPPISSSGGLSVWSKPDQPMRRREPTGALMAGAISMMKAGAGRQSRSFSR